MTRRRVLTLLRVMESKPVRNEQPTKQPQSDSGEDIEPSHETSRPKKKKKKKLKAAVRSEQESVDSILEQLKTTRLAEGKAGPGSGADHEKTADAHQVGSLFNSCSA